MKKYKDMNGHEKIAARNIKGAFNWLVGGWYNCFLDGYEEDIPSLEEAKETVYSEAMTTLFRGGSATNGKAPKEMRFAGEEFCRGIVERLFAKDEDAKELWGEEVNNINTTENKEEDKTMMEKKTISKEMLSKLTVKELKAMAKELCIEGMSRAKKEELVEAILNSKDAKPAFTATVSKVNMYAFTGMLIGEFEAEVQDDKILVYTASKGELMFDLSTGKELCEESKTRYANRVEAV